MNKKELVKAISSEINLNQKDIEKFKFFAICSNLHSCA